MSVGDKSVRSLKVRDIMVSPVVTVGPETPAPVIASLMHERNIGCVVVVDGSGAMLGIVTDTDFAAIRRSVPFKVDLAAAIYGLRPATPAEMQRIMEMGRKLTARELMADSPPTVAAGDDVSIAVHRLLNEEVRHVAVVEAGKPVGIVSRHDVLKLLMAGGS